MNLPNFLGGPTARLLPAERLHGPTVAVVAIMTFAMALVAAAGLALAQTSASVATAAHSRLVVQLPAGVSGDDAASTIARLPGVRSAEPISEEEMRATLEGWLGDAASSADLPVPVLVTVDTDPAADTTRLESAIAASQPGAAVSSEAAELAPLLRTIWALQAVAVGLVLLMAVANAAAIVLAARGALDTHRSTVEIMHGIGATDRQVTRLFVRKIAIDAIVGALGGATLAAVVLIVVGGQLVATAGGLGTTASLGAWGIFALLLMPVAAVLLVIGVARWTLLTSLRETL